MNLGITGYQQVWVTQTGLSYVCNATKLYSSSDCFNTNSILMITIIGNSFASICFASDGTGIIEYNQNPFYYNGTTFIRQNATYSYGGGINDDGSYFLFPYNSVGVWGFTVTNKVPSPRTLITNTNSNVLFQISIGNNKVAYYTGGGVVTQLYKIKNGVGVSGLIATLKDAGKAVRIPNVCSSPSGNYAVAVASNNTIILLAP